MKYIGFKQIGQILEPIIKRDRVAKVVAFLVQFSTYLPEPLNLIIASLSSSGKSYILLNVSKLFPEEDVIKLGYSSPKAFFHEIGEYDKKKNQIFINLEKKNLIFLDQPHPELLTKIRPLLSHDEKELHIKITDKNQKGGNLTKNVVIRGFPSVSFATAYLKLDEQEITRALIISPEISKEKIEESIQLEIERRIDENFQRIFSENEGLKMLKEKIESFKNISKEMGGIVYKDEKGRNLSTDEIFNLFKGDSVLIPRDTRNIKKFLTLAECFAGLNFENRLDGEGRLIVEMEDITETKKLWEEIKDYQNAGIVPFAIDVYKKVILPLHIEEKKITKKVLMIEIKEKLNVNLQSWYLEQQILPVLEAGGYIAIEKDFEDRRQNIVIPLVDVKNREKTESLEDLEFSVLDLQ